MEKTTKIKKKIIKKTKLAKDKISKLPSKKNMVKPRIIIHDQRGKISETGYWIIENEKANKQHAFDPNLAVAIKNLVYKIGYNENDQLYDLGCGKGDYVKYFNTEKIKAIGFDGNPNTKKFCKICEIKDLTKPLNKIPVKFVMSLEVAEHIPKDKEYLYIKTLNDVVTEDGYLIISWAYPGQGGFGHFNELDNAYCKKLFLSLGYENKEDYEKYLRYRAKLKWFKYTLMVFQKKKIIEMSEEKMKELYFLINEESEKNIEKIKELKKMEQSDFKIREQNWDVKKIDKKYDLSIEQKMKINQYFEKIYLNDLIKKDLTLELLNSELSIKDLPSINNLNIEQIMNSNKFKDAKLSIIKNILKNQDIFILSFPKDFREFIYSKKVLFLRNMIILSLIWYMILFSDFKVNDKKENYYDLYMEIYKNKYKYSLDDINKINNIEGYYLFFIKTLCESYMFRKNTHLYFLMLNLNYLREEYMKHNELDIQQNILEPVYTKMLIDIKAYGLNENKDTKNVKNKFDEKYINNFLIHVKNLINTKNLEYINQNLLN